MKFATVLVVGFVSSLGTNPQTAPAPGEWVYHGGDFSNAKYAPLDQIDASNFQDVQVAWKWKSIVNKVTDEHRRVRPGRLQSTPLVVDGLMYVTTAVCQIAALDPGTGETVWEFDPESYRAFLPNRRPPNLGYQHRGVSYWTDGADARIFIATHDLNLWAIDAKTGKPCADFGDGGKVDLSTTIGRPVIRNQITHSSPVGICRDTVIVGSICYDGVETKWSMPGHVRGFDARTGEMKWRFHTIPQEGEFGSETWENESWKYAGNSNVWSMFASDEELGYVYLPTGTPSGDMYGGHRLGDNLFAESLVCLDADTGKRIWHFQAVRHGLWDYDFPTGPNLADITVDGRAIKAVAQVSKQGFCYVLDRVTGEPVWPIDDRPVPPSRVPGERAAATQPFPTKPAAFEHQGITEDDLIDFTPELRAAALKAVEGFEMGPLFTPPNADKGTIGRPGAGGGANWPGAALDPETNILYVPSNGMPGHWRAVPTRPDGTLERPLEWSSEKSDLPYLSSYLFGRAPGAKELEGLPITKPPYSRVTAIDLDTGEHVWMTPHGDGPVNHPLLKDLDLPPMGLRSRGGPMVTETLLFVGQGASLSGTERDKPAKLSVFDKATGKILGRIVLPSSPMGNPMTYLHEGRQYIAVTTVDREVVALALP